MSRPAITPTDASKPLPANPSFAYSPPVTGRDGLVWICGGVVADVVAHNAHAQARGNGRDWGRK